MLIEALNKLDSNYYKRLGTAERANTAASLYALEAESANDRTAVSAAAQMLKLSEQLRRAIEKNLQRSVDTIV